jgi:flagella basal body P-ring formation protein FlgA
MSFTPRHHLIHALLCLIAYAFSLSAPAQTQSKPEFQKVEALIQVGKEFLLKQSQAYAGAVDIKMGQIDERLKLAPCLDVQAFLPPGSKAWGKITIGLRCQAPQNWTVYVQAQVKVQGHYYVSARALNQGQLMSETELIKMQGELSELPNGAITHLDQANGKTLSFNIGPGQVVRADMLKSPLLIQQGQNIKLTYQGNGFQVSNEATALNNASEGQTVRVKTNGGSIVTGIAKNKGIVEVQ